MAESRLKILPWMRPISVLPRARVLRAMEGVTVSDPDKFRRAADLRHRQTERMARVLEAAGISMRREGEDVIAYGLDTHEWKKPETRWRECMLLPDVQIVQRAKDRTYLAAYLEFHPKGKFARFLVVTTGPRCTIEEIGERLDWLHEKSRRFRRLLERYDVELVVRSDEVTVDPGAMAHPHANLVVIPLRVMGPERWASFLKAMREHFDGNWVRDAGRLQDVNEAVKYAVKYSVDLADGLDDVPSDATVEGLKATLDGLLAETPADPKDHVLVRLHHQLERRKMCQPYGGFRDFCRRIRDERLKLWRDPKGGKLAAVRMPPVQAPPKASEPRAVENWVLAITLPFALHGQRVEPVALVLGYTEDPLTPEGRNGLVKLRTLAERLRSDEALRFEESEERKRQAQEAAAEAGSPLSFTPAGFLTAHARAWQAARGNLDPPGDPIAA